MAHTHQLSKQRLERVLNQRLALRSPQYFLEKIGGRLIGNVISPSFKGKGDSERQGMIADALESELGPDAARVVGMILAYTPDEWALGAQTNGSTKKRKAG